MVGGRQYLNLATTGCRNRGIIIHEILHALGVLHEHQRPDRDNYLNIYIQNVRKGFISSFYKYSTRVANTMGIEYDFASTMHYGTKAYSVNGRHTLYPKDPDNAKYIVPSYRSGLGYTDVKLLNLMYKCASHCPNKDKCTEDGHLDQNCNCICKDGSQECDTTKTSETDQTSQNKYFNSWACYRWAAEGHCVLRLVWKSQNWMSENCAKACEFYGKDDPPKAVCQDVYSKHRCNTWKARGECVTNPELMYKTCRKTCNLCEGINARRPENSCSNSRHYGDRRCNHMARKGSCQINRSWMAQNCAKSCLAC